MIGKKRYSLLEAFWILVRALAYLPQFHHVTSKGILRSDCKERIMLAVTEVNGCALCSYAHTQMALEAGLSPDEIKQLLAGEQATIPKEELPAILFAQHCADQRGKPSKQAIKRIIEVYGKNQANAIYAATCIIMAGNTYGIPFGSLKSRINGYKAGIDARSSVLYEVLMLLSLILYLPLGVICAILYCIFFRRGKF